MLSKLHCLFFSEGYAKFRHAKALACGQQQTIFSAPLSFWLQHEKRLRAILAPSYFVGNPIIAPFTFDFLNLSFYSSPRLPSYLSVLQLRQPHEHIFNQIGKKKRILDKL